MGGQAPHGVSLPIPRPRLRRTDGIADAWSHPHRRGLGQRNDVARFRAGRKARPRSPGYRRLLLASNQSPVPGGAATRAAAGPAPARPRRVPILGALRIPLCWGDPLIPEFDLVVFLVVPTEVRLARLRAREVERYGQEALGPGGTLHQAHVEFLDWAARYDGGGPEMPSRVLHEAWLSTLPGAVLRLEGDRSVVEQLARIQASVEAEKA